MEQAFNRTKSAVEKADKLYLLDPKLNLSLTTDASTIGIGAKLAQFNEHGEEFTIAYASRTLRGAERRYTVTELEGLALVWALKKWRVLLMGRKVRVRTDHKALKFISARSVASQRIARWQAFLQEFNLDIRHIAGVDNTSADTLSRKPLRKQKDKTKHNERALIVIFIRR